MLLLHQEIIQEKVLLLILTEIYMTVTLLLVAEKEHPVLTLTIAKFMLTEKQKIPTKEPGKTI